MTADNVTTSCRSAAEAPLKSEVSNVLPFPTARKRPYPRCYVPKDELPPNAVRLAVGAFKDPEPLSYAGLEILCRAQLACMTWPDQQRLHRQLETWLDRLPPDHENRDAVTNARSVLMRMPCRSEEPGQTTA